VKLVSEQPPADAEAESPRVLAPEPIQSFVADEPGRTGRDDLLAAFRSLHGIEAWVVTEGFRTLAGIAVWRLSTPRPHLMALTLGFSQLDRALFPWEESGRGFELVCRLEATSESLPGWLIGALDELLTHTFSVRAEEQVRLGKVWCLATPEPGLERLDTVNGAVRVVSLSPRDGGFLQGDANELVPSSAPDDETGRTEVCWEFDDESTVSLFGLDVVMDDRVRRHDSRAEALLAFEKAVTAQLQVQPGHRSVHRRPPAPRASRRPSITRSSNRRSGTVATSQSRRGCMPTGSRSRETHAACSQRCRRMGDKTSSRGSCAMTARHSGVNSPATPKRSGTSSGRTGFSTNCASAHPRTRSETAAPR
jgi:hypothetical protein